MFCFGQKHVLCRSIVQKTKFSNKGCSSFYRRHERVSTHFLLLTNWDSDAIKSPLDSTDKRWLYFNGGKMTKKEGIQKWCFKKKMRSRSFALKFSISPICLDTKQLTFSLKRSFAYKLSGSAENLLFFSFILNLTNRRKGKCFEKSSDRINWVLNFEWKDQGWNRTSFTY